MVEQEVLITFGRPERFGRTRNRSQRDINRYYKTRYRRWRDAGFNDEAATWAASHGIPLEGDQAKRALFKMKELVKFYVRHGATKEKALELANDDLATKIEKAGETEWIPLYILSP